MHLHYAVLFICVFHITNCTITLIVTLTPTWEEHLPPLYGRNMVLLILMIPKFGCDATSCSSLASMEFFLWVHHTKYCPGGISSHGTTHSSIIYMITPVVLWSTSSTTSSKGDFTSKFDPLGQFYIQFQNGGVLVIGDVLCAHLGI